MTKKKAEHFEIPPTLQAALKGVATMCLDIGIMPLFLLGKNECVRSLSISGEHNIVMLKIAIKANRKRSKTRLDSVSETHGDSNS